MPQKSSKETIIIWLPIIISITIVIYLITKQLNQKEDITINRYDIPKIEELVTERIKWKAGKKEKKLKIKVTGILKLNKMKIAIINGLPYKEKEKINKRIEIEKIEEKFIIVKIKNKKIKIGIGDEVEAI